MYRKLPQLLCVLGLCAGLGASFGCGPSEPPRDTFVDKEYPVPELRFAGVDLSRIYQPGSVDLVLATVLLKGTGEGSAEIAVNVLRMDDDSGDLITPTVVAGTIDKDASSVAIFHVGYGAITNLIPFGQVVPFCFSIQ